MTAGHRRYAESPAEPNHAHHHVHHHAHHHGDPDETPPWRFILTVIAPCAVVVLVCMLWLWPSDVDPPKQQGEAGRQLSGVVTVVDKEPCPKQPDNGGGPTPKTEVCGEVLVRVLEGPDEGDEVLLDLPKGPGAPTVTEGDEVVLVHVPDSVGGEPYQLVDHQRGNQLWLIGIAFVLAVIAFGRWKGITALAGLAVTFAVLLLFVVPAILGGQPPLLVAIVGSAAIMLTVLYLTHGVNRSTTVAVVGTLASLVLTGVLAAVAVGATHLTGVADEDSSYLSLVYGVNTQGLLLAAILIGSLGVLDDVTVTQSATVTELARANPRYGFVDLYRSATRVGRSHIASVINTIILAYAGASLPVLLLIAGANQPLGQVLTDQLIAQEFVRSAVGTIGLIAAVPLTTALAAFTARRGLGTHASENTREAQYVDRERAMGVDHDASASGPDAGAGKGRRGGWSREQGGGPKWDWAPEEHWDPKRDWAAEQGWDPGPGRHDTYQSRRW